MGDEFVTMVDERIRHDKEEINHLSKGEENINSDCQSIEEPKGWRFDWRKIIPLEPTAELIILVLLALLYGGFYYYDHYTVNER
ncbi:MAG: hypothetical protein ACLS9T_06725 [Streptococcus salivarius]